MLKSCQIEKLHDALWEIPYFGSATAKSFLHQQMLRPPVHAKKFSIITRSEHSGIIAVANYVKANPDTATITGERLDRQEKIYENRIRLKERPEFETTIEVEVVKLETGRLEFEVVF